MPRPSLAAQTARFPKLAAARRWAGLHRRGLTAWFIVFSHVVGALTSVRAILDTRTSQGAIAWAVSLNTFPYLAVPAYWVFGRSSFEGYVMLRRAERQELTERQQEIARDMDPFRLPPGEEA